VRAEGQAHAHTLSVRQGGWGAAVLPGLTATGGAWAGTSRRKLGALCPLQA
jgi:hypothetical protein